MAEKLFGKRNIIKKDMFKKVDTRQKFPEMEKEVLKFWEENKIFEKSLAIRKNAKKYSFYDGPPFATGTPHYGHIVASVMKDVVPRYWTMRGYYVERKWGWDCHGLPIENIVEKEMGSQKKKDIEEVGVEKFNEMCRSKVLGYVDEWKKVISRLGRWADMENAYKTMDLDYMESVWWVFKELWDRGLVYEDYRSMHICPRCETTLSQSEVAEGYKDVKDLSVIAKFKLKEKQKISGKEIKKNTFVLAWTTTPWTLPGNVALAVGKDIDYVLVEKENENNSESERFILAENKLEEVFGNSEYKILNKFKGKDLVGLKYKPLWPEYVNSLRKSALSRQESAFRKEGWQVYDADFVTTEEGTGVVHIAPAFGEDDMKLGKEKNLPFVQHVGMDGVIDNNVEAVGGLNVKTIDNPQATDVEVVKYLAGKGLLFHKEKYEHSYPHCWRCDTPLINYATSSWFIAVTKIKEEALKLAKEINWTPENMKEGRFGNWLEGARDWSISRQRFWASVMPIWVCDKCGEKRVFGSVADLEKASGEKVADLHKHIVDKITFKCEKCEGTMKRVPDVLDTWFDSGSMPYAQKHYPFENEKEFEEIFPADFIAEGVDQTRAWFYYLHIIATGIKKQIAFKNVIVNGIVLAEDGKKMSKKLQNYPDPSEMFEKYGADAVRYYLMNSPVVMAQNLNFSEKEVAEITRGMMRMLWNSYSFFVLYANIDKFVAREDFNPQKLENSLDKWIVSELHILIKEFNRYMEEYKLQKAGRLLPKFVDNLSNWYIRRSRKRFWKSENDDDKNNAYQALYYVLGELSKVMAPFTPFIAEEIYKNLFDNKESVHLEDFPEANDDLIDEKLNRQMQDVRDIIQTALQLRTKAGIKVRQPLQQLSIMNDKLSITEELVKIIKEEVNVKSVEVVEDAGDAGSVVVWDEEGKVGLNTEITEELKLEGQAREIIRYIQQMRKEADYDIDNRIKIWHSGMSKVFDNFGDLIAKETLANKIEPLQDNPDQKFDLEKEFEIDGEKLKVAMRLAK